MSKCLPLKKTRSPITEEDFVDFLIQHKIQSAEELSDFSEMILLMKSEANEPCGIRWDIRETIH